MAEVEKSNLEPEPLLFPISFCLNPAYDENENPIYLLKISGRNFWELNVLVTEQELELIPHVKAASWNRHNSLEIGKCLGSTVFWSCDKGYIAILIGEDTECWDIGFFVKEEVLDDLIKEINFAKSEYVIKDNEWVY